MSKKESLASTFGAGAGELANFFDKFKKKGLINSTSTPPATDLTSSGSDSAHTSTASSIFSNLALNIGKKVLSDPKTVSLISGSKPSLSLSKLLNDNEEQDFECVPHSKKTDEIKASMPVSQSEFDFTKTRLSTHSITSSSSMTESLNKLYDASKESTTIRQISKPGTDTSQQTTTTSPSKLPTTSSLHRITSVFDGVVDSAHNEAESLRKRILTKKKSIESSFENIKTRMSSSGSTSQNLNTTIENINQNENVAELNSTINTTTPTQQQQQLSLDEVFPIDMSGTSNLNKPILVIEKAESLNNIDKNNNINIQSEPLSSSVLFRNQKDKTIHRQTSFFYEYKHVFAAILAVILVFLLAIPKSLSSVIIFYTAGIVSGFSLASGFLYLSVRFNFIKYFLKNIEDDSVEKSTNGLSFVSGQSDQIVIDQLQSLLLQTAVFKENRNFDGVYKGWMNELREVYDPESYFLNKTRSVYMSLDGSMLRIQTTSSRVAKRAVCGESITNVSFNDQRMYDLTNCEINNLPSELCRKRYWSKKYPLCIKGVKLLSRKRDRANNYLETTNNNINLTPSTPPQSSLSSNNLTTITSGNLDDSSTLILFGRTDREKEEWYKLFKKAAANKLLDSVHYLKLQARAKANSVNDGLKKEVISSFAPSLVDLNSRIQLSYSATSDKIIYKISVNTATAAAGESDKQAVMKSESSSNVSESSTSSGVSSQLNVNTQTENGLLYDSSLNFMNTFLIRVFADFFTHQHWISLIKHKIQNKLTKINVPYFMEELRILDLDLGSVIPLIKQVSEPWYDEKGLWVHFEIDYSGGLQMSLTTKLNLMKLKSTNTTSSGNTVNNIGLSFKNLSNEEKQNTNIQFLGLSPKETSQLIDINKTESPEVSLPIDQLLRTNSSRSTKSKRQRSAIQFSDEEDSPESSGDEYVHTSFNDEDNKLIETANPTKKLLNMVSKIASSNYFQKATENKYIKMAMENVSNCQLVLSVEVRKIAGTLALNIPPHPSDRLWYGFVSSPQMTLVATPQVGEKEVSYSAISDFIADKLKLEFQKVLVFPNMDDVYIPLLNSEIFSQNW